MSGSLKNVDRAMENANVLDRIHNCQANNEDLNGWEDDFLESFEDWVMEGKKVTPNQLETLEKIEYKVEWGVKAYWEEYGRD